MFTHFSDFADSIFFFLFKIATIVCFTRLWHLVDLIRFQFNSFRGFKILPRSHLQFICACSFDFEPLNRLLFFLSPSLSLAICKHLFTAFPSLQYLLSQSITLELHQLISNIWCQSYLSSQQDCVRTFLTTEKVLWYRVFRNAGHHCCLKFSL